MAVGCRVGQLYCIQAVVTQGRTVQHVAYGRANNVEASLMKEKSISLSCFSSISAKTLRGFPLETVGVVRKRGQRVIVAASPPTEDAVISTEPLTKEDLVGYLASGCKPKENWR